MARIFGWQITKKEEAPLEIFSPEDKDDGASIVVDSGVHNTFLDMDGTVKSAIELITRYRELSLQPEIESAIDDIINEMIAYDDNPNLIEINLDGLDKKVYTEKLQDIIRAEYQNVLDLYDLNHSAYEIVRRWYIDGRLYYYTVVDLKKPQDGIQKVRYIDPRKLRKIRVVKKIPGPDRRMGEMVQEKDEYYLYSENSKGAQNSPAQGYGGTTNTIKISTDSIVQVTSGLLDPNNSVVLSYLHKASKPLNQLRAIEDASVINRLVRAPLRRVFNVEVGTLPKAKAEQYLRDQMVKYKNKLTYDACLSMDTKIPLLDGRVLTLTEMQNEYESGKQMWAYSVDPNSGKVAPGLVSFAGVTKYDQEVMRITFDNGKSLVVTPDHKFPTWKRGIVKAEDLRVGESMMPLNRRRKNIQGYVNETKRYQYEQVFDHASGKWAYTHRLVSKWKDDASVPNETTFDTMFDGLKKSTIHHIDFNHFNNTPDNLTRMYCKDHLAYHGAHSREMAVLGIGFLGMSADDRKRIQIEANETHWNLYRTDPDYASRYVNAIKSGWSDESRAKLTDLGRERTSDPTFIEKWHRTSNDIRWGDSNAREKHSRIHSAEYPVSAIEYVKGHNGTKASVVTALNNNAAFIDEFVTLNAGKPIHNKSFDQFNGNDVVRMRATENRFHNHKITSIEYLVEKIDVGTLTIDREEKYHNYHTFATDSEIFVCNSSGAIKDNRHFMTMLEDYWFAKRAGTATTSVENLQGGDNFSVTDDLAYFLDRLYRSLNVPVSRLKDESGFSLGRPTEITRDELKFSKFISRLRLRFSVLLSETLKKQLILKNVISPDEANALFQKINFDFKHDVYFTELKEAEITNSRVASLTAIDPFVGKYFSREWVKTDILRQTEDDIKKESKQMDKEEKIFGPPQSVLQDKEGVLTVDSMEIQNAGADKQLNAPPEPDPPPAAPAKKAAK